MSETTVEAPAIFQVYHVQLLGDDQVKVVTHIHGFLEPHVAIGSAKRKNAVVAPKFKEPGAFVVWDQGAAGRRLAIGEVLSAKHADLVPLDAPRGSKCHYHVRVYAPGEEVPYSDQTHPNATYARLGINYWSEHARPGDRVERDRCYSKACKVEE